MKVLVVKPPGGAFQYITAGFINAFNAVGIEACYWSGYKDEFVSFNPDLYIGASAFRHEIPAQCRTKCKLALHVNPYCQNPLKIVHGNNINESQDAINWSLKQNPNVVFGYGYKDDAQRYWGYWTSKHGIPFVGVPTAGDATKYWPDPGQVISDACYIGGRWQFKGVNLDKWLLPVINGMNVNLAGWGGWQGIKGYKGPLPEGDSDRKFLSSAMVGPVISEPHTSIYGIDIPERFFKVALCGVLPISDYVPGFDRYYDKSDYLMASDPTEYYNLILNYARNSDFAQQRLTMIDRVRKATLRNHTYFNRMRDLCVGLGFNEAVELFDAKIKEISS